MTKSDLNIHLISPGFKVPPEDLKSTLNYWALNKPRVNFYFDQRLLNKTSNDLLCSGTVKERLQEFEKAFAEENSRFVWALRGGYGSQELMPYLKKNMVKVKKIFIGFSDCTSLHYFLNQELDLASLHAPHPNTFFKNMHSDEVLENMNKVLSGEETEFCFKNLERIDKNFQIQKNVDNTPLVAKIGGGNLTTLCSLIGTPVFNGFKDKFLFLEEIEEPAYKVRRLLEHLKQSGALIGAKALIFGHMTHSSETQEKLIKKVVCEFCKTITLPSFWGLKAGHKHEENHPLWFNKKSSLTLDESSTLVNNIERESLNSSN